MDVIDFLELACSSANVSYRSQITREELVQALATGKIPADKRPHLRAIFDDLPSSIFDSMVKQMKAIYPDQQIADNVDSIAKEICSQNRS